MPVEETRATPDSAPQLHGVTLEQYAGITAALAEAFPLAGVLALEGIAESRWPRAASAWKQRLAADGAEGTLFTAYREKLAEAEDWLARRVAPLDEDLAAWMSFLATWSAHPAPFELLASAGLGMNDMARLQRRWARRLEQDASLRSTAAELAQKEPAPLPPVTAAEAVLKPFPWSIGRPAPVPAPAPIATVAHEAPRADIPPVAEPANPAAPLPSWLASTAPALDLPQGPALPFVPGTAPPNIASSAPAEAPTRPAWKGLSDTAPMVDEPLAAPLPFEAPWSTSVAPVAPLAPLAQPAPANPPVAWLIGTAPALETPPGPALPFMADPSRSEPAATAKSAAALPAWLTGTALTLDTRGPALPSAEPAPSTTATTLKQSARTPPKELTGTALALEAPGGPALPFMAGAPRPVAEAPKRSSSSMLKELSGTAPLLDAPHGRALPFAENSSAPPTSTASAPPSLEPMRPPTPRRTRNPLGEVSLALPIPKDLPPANSAERTSPVIAGSPALANPPLPASPPPPLTLEQHASLCIELAMDPSRNAETLARYRQTPESKAQLDNDYRERFARDPVLRAAWNRAYQAYGSWLAARRPPSR